MKRVRARRLASLLTVIVLLLAFGLMAAYATGGSVARAEELLGAPTDDPCVWKNADDYYVKFSDGTVPYKFSSSSPFVYSSWDDVGYALGTTWQVEVYTDAACETEHSSKPDLCFAEHESDANAFGSVLSPENLTEEKIGLFDVLLYTGSYGSATFTPRAKVVIAVGIEIEDTSVTVSYHYDANLTFVYGDEEGFDALAAADYYDMIDVSGNLGDKTKEELFTLTFKKGSRSGEEATLTARAAVNDYYLVVSSNDDSFDFSFAVNEDENAFIRVTPKELAVNWTNLSFGYDGQPHVPTATLTASDLEEDDEVDLSAVTGAQVDANANHVATTQLIGDGAANYTLTNPSTTFAITKAALTLTIESKVTVYGDLVAFSAIKEGETYDSDDSIFTFVCVDGEDQPIGASTGVGVYDISLAFGERAANYDITVTEEKATYTVNRRAITVAIDAKTSTYGAAPKALTARVTDGSIVEGDAPYVLVCEGLTQATAVGKYDVIGTPNDDNYAVTFVGGENAYTVTSATLQGVSVQADALTYNGSAQTPNVTAAATAVNGQAIAFTYSLTEEGEYGELPTFKDYAEGGYTVYYKATAPNHTEASGSFTVTVAKRAITVTIDAKTSVYGEEQVALSAQVTFGSVIEGDAPYVLACEGVTSTASVGEYDVIGTPNDDNYAVTFVGGTKAYTVAPATLQGVSVQADALTYNGSAQAPVVTAAATAVNGQAVTFTYSLTENGEYGELPAFRDYAEGGYIVYYKATAANHTEASGAFTVTVNKRKIYLTIDPKSSVYGEKPLELSAQVTNGSIVEGENAPYVLECNVTATTAVGSYAISGTGTNDNYAVVFVGESDAYTVTPATLRDVAVQDVTLTYNGKAQSVAAITAATAVNEMPVTFTYSLAKEGEYGDLPTFKDYAEGGYTVYYKAVAENHYVAEGSFTVTVAKRAITVAIDSKTSTYGATPLELTARVTVGSVAEGDAVPYALVCEGATNTAAVGSYAIGGSVENTNYDITFEGNAFYTVTPATLRDVSVQAAMLTYNGAAQTPNVTAAATAANELPVTFTYSLTENGEYGELPTFKDYAEGGYIVYYKATAANHVEASGTFTVTLNKRKIFLTIDPKSSVYGEAPKALSARVTNGSIVEGEKAPYVLECKVTRTTAVGSYAIIGTGTNDNYAVVFVGESNAYTVTPATLRDVAVQDVTLTYNGSAQTPNVTAAATAVNGQAVTFTYALSKDGAYAAAVPAFTDWKEGGYTVYYKATAANHAEASGSFTVTIDRIPVALNLYVDGRLVTEAVKLVYDGTEHTFVVKAAGVQGDVITLSEKVSSTVFAVKDRVIDAKALAADGKEIENYLLVEAFCVPDHEIVKKAITVTAEAKAVTYGDADAALTATVTDENGAYRFPSGVSASDVYALTRAAGRTAGTYAITVIPANNANYDVTATDGVYTIGKKPLVVTADDKESGYREALAALTVTLDSTVAEGDVVYVIRTTADADKVGTYPITLTATEYGAANYALTLVNGTYTVRVKAPELVETDDGKKVAEHEEEISVEEVKTEGVSITEMINYAIESSKADDVDEVTLTLKITDETAEEGAEDAVVPTVTFNRAALEQLKDQLANGTLSDVKITYEEKSAEQIDRNDEKTKSAELVLEISLQGASFEGGVATITTRFENKAPRGKKAVLYYVDADGNKTDMNATFEGGVLTFETGHFSTYVVEYVLTGGSVSGIAIGCTVGTAGIAFCLLFFLRRKKGARRTQETRSGEQEALPSKGDGATPSETTVTAVTESDAPAESTSREPTPESSAETASTAVPTTPSHAKKGGKKGKKGKR